MAILQAIVLLDAPPSLSSRLSNKTRYLVPHSLRLCCNGHLGIFGRKLVHVCQQSHHAEEAGYRENIDRRRRFFADVDLLVRDVVQHGECLRHGCQWPLV